MLFTVLAESNSWVLRYFKIIPRYVALKLEGATSQKYKAFGSGSDLLIGEYLATGLNIN
jgi:hypothetical protein